MGLFGDRTVVAVDASGLTGSTLPGRLRAREAVVERVAFEPGAVLPSPTEPNVPRPAVVKAALSELLGRLGGPPRVTLLLPLGLARFSLLAPAPGTDPREFARFRLAPTLPYSGAEAIVDVVPAGDGQVLAAAVRREVVSGYEALFADGPELERVDLCPLPALGGRRPDPASPAVFVFLGDVAFAAALVEEGSLRAFHARYRTSEAHDADRIARVAASASARHRGAVAPRVVVLGEGSEAMAASLLGRGVAASSGPRTALLGAAA